MNHWQFEFKSHFGNEYINVCKFITKYNVKDNSNQFIMSM